MYAQTYCIYLCNGHIRGVFEQEIFFNKSFNSDALIQEKYQEEIEKEEKE